MIVFTFLNQAGCMISSAVSETDVKEGINYALAIVDLFLVMVSISHLCTALLRATKYK